jgi:uncharacterized protein
MPILHYDDGEALGTVHAVDTGTVTVVASNLELLRQLQVNRLVALRSGRPGQHLIGLVQRISRTQDREVDEPDLDALLASPTPQINHVRVLLIGTLIDQDGTRQNVLTRTLNTVPEIDAHCFPIEGERLSDFMRNVAGLASSGDNALKLGTYTLDESAEAYLNGNRFFQRHAVIVGSTGSGKSWTTAKLIESMAPLPSVNSILFDVHGEYSPLVSSGIQHLRVAGPSDLDTDNSLDDGVLYLPYWLLGYEQIIELMVDRSDQNAPNQASVIANLITEHKRAHLEKTNQTELLDNFTIDSPVPFSLDNLLEELRELDVGRVPSPTTGKPVNGPYYGRLTRLILRLSNRKQDRRLGFLFGGPDDTNRNDYLPRLAQLLCSATNQQKDSQGGVKIIDFSDVPSDILPLMVSLVAKFIFELQQWTPKINRKAIALLCDEAHLYMAADQTGGFGQAALQYFGRIAKEGRKYGVGLVVISQRPSEVNRTILSQCNNFISMRLTNAEDQAVIKRLFPENIASFGDILPILETGEALVVGDASVLPTRVKITEPVDKPDSATINFWDDWANSDPVQDIDRAVVSLRMQSLQG